MNNITKSIIAFLFSTGSLGFFLGMLLSWRDLTIPVAVFVGLAMIVSLMIALLTSKIFLKAFQDQSFKGTINKEREEKI